MEVIRARAPLRLGLAGGGTDVSPYCNLFGGYVLNATIDRYAYAVIKVLTGTSVSFVAADREITELRKASFDSPFDGDLSLHNAVYSYMMKHHNHGNYIPLELITFCDAPAGSGLGSSSTLVVAMIRAFVELLSLGLDDYAIAALAYKLERVECGLQGGHQDQYSATFGGFNFMEFYGDDKVIVNPLRISPWIISELEASLILFFTGISRESAKVIADQSANIKNGDDSALESMHGMKGEALAMKECLLKGNFEGFAKSMRLGWEDKKRTSKAVSNPYIDAVYSSAIDAGVLAGKVSGAGGGGFMLFFAPPDKRMKIIKALKSFEGQVSNCHFTKRGAEAWRIR
jgi:D-glycero-alpha-D-manno-heptose-7-phosphate kinase